MFAREHRGAQRVILRQEYNNLQAVLQYYQFQHRIQDIENNAMRVVIADKKQEKDELIRRRELRLQQEWERRD